MFNLVGKRYLFLGISLLIILPGTIFLIFAHLNVGIDFKGGSSIEVRPDSTFSTTTQVQNLMTSLHLKDLQVTLGEDNTLPGKQTIWVRLNTAIDTNAQSTITSVLQGKYGKSLNVTFSNLIVNGKAVTQVTIVQTPKGTPLQVSVIQTLLAKLPDTSDPSKGVSSTAAATPTPAPSGTSTPAAGATATPKATPKATPTQAAKATATPSAGTPTATPTPVSNANPANIPVKVEDIRQGSTIQTLLLLTSTPIDPTLQTQILSSFFSGHNTYVQTLDIATVQGSVAQDTTRNAIFAIIAASVLILLYVWFSFRKVSKPWRYGTCAIIALLHDVLVVLGVFAILGYFFAIQVDALFITALLTVVGFSVHDTIVVFDRIRENMQRRTSESFEEVVNASLVQTLARSLNTSLTVIITLSALTLFGGLTIRQFTGTLLLGIISGTYSSIFNASMLLVIWEKGEMGMGRFRREYTADGRKVKERELARTRG